ncbi:MAG: exo-alpha-sialidase [Acidobacteria bacterium]|nr:exo-alpha-sialidase [Acidobacteriota bacterium]
MRSMGLLAFLSSLLWAQPQDYNERGFDPRVDYNQMFLDSANYGIPWDDRNLDLTLEDLSVLPDGEFEDTQKIPLFFRVGFRKANPDMRTFGEGQYPRSAPEVYQLNHGGPLIDGVFVKHEHRAGVPIVNNGEVDFTSQPGSAESAISINPMNTNRVVAGINWGAGGQGMLYSSDGGASWNFSTVLSGSCCDPAVAWSPDGTVAYTVTLSNCGVFSACAVHFYRSTNNGQTWIGPVAITSGQTSDKEYIHVDTHPTSPHLGNIYVTWHDNNVLKFARSTNGGTSFDPQIQFAGSQGIGSDITSDSAGNIYHFWPSTSNGSIQVAKSTNGGTSFGTPTQVHDTFASFDYPIPSFDNRRAFVYVAADVDLSGGPFHDRIYAVWNDTNAPESGTAANNHSLIEVAVSDNGGASWTITNPHSLADVLTVDRFNPWLEVDEQGVVHVIFYDTRNDAQRRKPDIYHAASEDGGSTWTTPFRVTAVSSNYINDSFQWGDYAGLSVVSSRIRPSWTDNRSTVEGYTALMEQMIVQGDFSLSSANNTRKAVCPGETTSSITLDLAPIDGFTGTVDLDFQSLPAGVMGSISPMSVVVPGSATVTLTPNSPAVGDYDIVVEGTSGSLTHDITLDLFVRGPLNVIYPLWQNTGLFNADYDFDTNGVIDIADEVAAVDCLE